MEWPRFPRTNAVSRANPSEDIHIPKRQVIDINMAYIDVLISIVPLFTLPVSNPPNLLQMITSANDIAKLVRAKKKFHPIPNSFQGY